MKIWSTRIQILDNGISAYILTGYSKWVSGVFIDHGQYVFVLGDRW